MFSVYINDISDILQSSSIKLFADDALLYRPVNTLEDSVKFQEDLASLEQWASQWKMSFNTEKRQIVRFARQDCDNFSPEYFLNNIPLALVKSFKYLGVFISNNFSWDFHIETITARASQRLGMMKHVPFDAPRRVKRVAYLTLCWPLLKYACEVWNPHLARQVSLLKGVQRKAIRFILGIRAEIALLKRKFL